MNLIMKLAIAIASISMYAIIMTMIAINVARRARRMEKELKRHGIHWDYFDR